ncbi:hypothetical protein NSQ11_06015 [Bacillus sp. FSL W7-1582]|uniref:hypothetical protein n=1 Tax=Bacillus TaxID=1386 RepID=UPI0022DD7FFA|nr:hypothetical protein [Bacillus altitudinis]WBL50358.1 hypothetical protein LOS13_12530 [Bacillus altitudinis]
MSKHSFHHILNNMIFKDVQLIEVSDYYYEMEKHSQNSQNKYSEQLINALKASEDGLADEELDEYIAEIYAKGEYYKKTHAKLLRKNTFLEIYSLFENYLNKKCELCQEILDIDIGLKDVPGKGIKRAKEYLTEHGQITAPFSSHLWRDIKLYGKVRNAIVHANSTVENKEGENKEGKNKKFGIKNLPGLIVTHKNSENFSFTLDENFVPSCLKTVRDFVDLLK